MLVLAEEIRALTGRARWAEVLFVVACTAAGCLAVLGLWWAVLAAVAVALGTWAANGEQVRAWRFERRRVALIVRWRARHGVEEGRG